MHDRILPHNLDAEKSILGAILLHPEVYVYAADLVSAADFYRTAHRQIFTAMLQLQAHNIEIDLTTLKAELQKTNAIDEVGGPAYISSLVDGVPRSTNVEHYARIVREHAIGRGVVVALGRGLDAAYDAGDPSSVVIDRTFTDLLQLSQRSTGVGLRPVGDFIHATMEQIEALSNVDSMAWGEKSGLSALDRKLRGFRPGKMIVVAGRPGDGKTSLALNIATAVAKRGSPVGVFSLEMDRAELMLPLVCAEARVNIEDLAEQRLTQSDWQRLAEAYEVFGRIPLHIDDSTDLNPITLRAKARRRQIEGGLNLIVVDYIQLMQGIPSLKSRPENEHERLTGISRQIKLLSKDLGVPIIVCCQLNRAPEARTDYRPQLGDLRGSGSLEQDADTVVLIFDPAKAPKKKGFKKKLPNVVEQELQKGVVEFIIAKNRGLSTGSVSVLFDREYTRFRNLEL